MANRKYIVGNWKMNGDHAALAQAKDIAGSAVKHPGVDAALCPPATLIAPMVAAVGAFAVGGQDCHEAEKGAFTGSISAGLLKDAGATLTLAGHSERREGCGESDADVQAKAVAAMATGLDVILCCGEPKNVREDAEAEAYVLTQLDGSLPDIAEGRTLAVAYEPIWAIGTGLTPTAEDVRVMHAAIRGKLIDRYGPDQGAATRILYGGSVTRDNAAELLAVDNVDGALVGGASLTAAKFVPIIEAAAAL